MEEEKNVSKLRELTVEMGKQGQDSLQDVYPWMKLSLCNTVQCDLEYTQPQFKNQSVTYVRNVTVCFHDS